MPTGRPLRGRSCSPSQRLATNRASQRRTVVRLICSRRARARLPKPEALPRTTRARRTRRWGVVPARTQLVKRRYSAAVNAIEAADPAMRYLLAGDRTGRLYGGHQLQAVQLDTDLGCLAGHDGSGDQPGT